MLIAFLLLVGCGSPDPSTVDADLDGAFADVDCDDAHPLVHPGAVEACDLVDNDCDGEVDEDAADASTWYRDADGDGYGDPSTPVVACQGGNGLVLDSADCDDASAAAHPGRAEVWYDGVDGDCSGGSDFDADGDGVEAPANGGEDCDDQEPTVHPGATEQCNAVDDDCSGRIDDGADCGPCTVQWLEDVPWLFCPQQVDWKPARQFCADRGYVLALVDDGKETAFVAKHVPNQRVWIGLRVKSPTEGTWVDGADRPYRNWGKAPPRGQDRCAVITRSAAWSTDYCFYSAGFACEGVAR